MKRRFDGLVRVALFSLAALAFAAPARALTPVTLTFEDLDRGYPQTGPLVEYGGFTWSGAGYVVRPGPDTPYAVGTLGYAAAYLPMGATVDGYHTLRRTDGSRFDFTSAVVTPAIAPGTDYLWVEAHRDGLTVDSRFVEISASAGQPAAPSVFGFADVDEVWIYPYMGDVTMDDVLVSVDAAPPPPPPPTDTVPPTIELADVPALVARTEIILQGRAFDQDLSSGGLVASVTVAGGAPRTFSPDPISGAFALLVPLAEGPNDIVLEVVDAAGNAAHRAVHVVRDTIAPRVEFLLPTSQQVVRTLEFPVSLRVDDASALTVVLDGWNHVPVENGVATTTMFLWQAQGPQWITAEATDAAGNTSQAAVEVIADVSPFSVSVDVASGTAFGPLPGDLLPIRISVEGPYPATVDLSTGGSWSVPGGGGVVDAAVPLVEGPKAFTVTATSIPHGDVVAATVLVTYDTTPPAAAFQTPAGGAFVRGTVEVVLDASDASTAVAGVSFAVDGGAAIPATGGAPWSASLDLAALADGAHAISATVTDSVGNAATTSVGVILDATAPHVAITSPAAGAWVRGTISVVAEASDATSGIRGLRLLANGAEIGACVAATRCEASIDTTALPNAALALAAVATDGAGNEETAQAVVDVDNDAPSKFLVAPADGQMVSGTVEVVFAVQDPGFAWAECFVGGTSLGVRTEPAFRATADVSQVPDGSVEVACTAADLAGNAATERVTVTVRNWKLTLDPRVLSTRANPGCSSVVTLYVEGKTVALLAPASAHALALAVPGGATTPLVVRPAGEQVGDADGDGIPDLTLKFDRAALLSAIRGALAAGTIAPGAPVPVRLLDGERTLGATTIELR